MAVSDSNLPPEQWRPLFDAIGVEFGYRALATHTGMTHTAIRRFMRGEGTTDKTARGIADAFRVPVSKVYELRGESISIYEPFTLPDEAGRLNHNEREVIRSVVRALLEARDERHVLEIAASSGTPPQGRPPEEVKPPSGNGPKSWTPPADWGWPPNNDTGVSDGEDAQDA